VSFLFLFAPSLLVQLAAYSEIIPIVLSQVWFGELQWRSSTPCQSSGTVMAASSKVSVERLVNQPVKSHVSLPSFPNRAIFRLDSRTRVCNPLSVVQRRNGQNKKPMKPKAIALICGFLAACEVSCNDHKDRLQHRNTDGITLDADVPGTEVYLAEQKLGTVPVTLSATRLASLGVPNPRTDTNAILNSDGFGETVNVIGVTGTESKCFMFLVPANVRSNYISVETPWGGRTRHTGGSIEPGKSFRVNCAKVIGRDGLSLHLNTLNPISSNAEPWKLRVSLTNHGPQSIKGFRPSLKICHSQLGKRWAHRGPREVNLPAEWASLDPGKAFHTDISIDPPEAQGDCGAYLIFSLFKDETSNHLAGQGWCYSNTILLSVR